MHYFPIHTIIKQDFPTYIYSETDEIAITFNVEFQLLPISHDSSSKLDWEIKDITWERSSFDEATNLYIEKYVTEKDTMTMLVNDIYDSANQY